MPDPTIVPFKRGTVPPPTAIVLRGAPTEDEPTGAPDADIADATLIRCDLRNRKVSRAKVKSIACSVGDGDGEATIDWQAGDLNIPVDWPKGYTDYEAEFYVEWNDGARSKIYPNALTREEAYLIFRVWDDVDDAELAP